MSRANIQIAPSSGFCFGVKRATDKLEERIACKKDGERIFTLGKLIHNESYIKELAAKGVSVTSLEELDALLLAECRIATIPARGVLLEDICARAPHLDCCGHRHVVERVDAELLGAFARKHRAEKDCLKVTTSVGLWIFNKSHSSKVLVSWLVYLLINVSG